MIYKKNGYTYFLSVYGMIFLSVYIFDFSDFVTLSLGKCPLRHSQRRAMFLRRGGI